VAPHGLGSPVALDPGHRGNRNGRSVSGASLADRSRSQSLEGDDTLRSMDVTLLCLDAEAQIQCFTAWGKAHIAPLRTGDEIRARMQATRIVAFDQKTGAPLPVGRERLMVIGVEKPERDPIGTTFCHLAQQGIAGARGAAASLRRMLSAFERLLSQSGIGHRAYAALVPVSEHEEGDVVNSPSHLNRAGSHAGAEAAIDPPITERCAPQQPQGTQGLVWVNLPRASGHLGTVNVTQ
jgi:hypothetical protein